MDRTADLQRKQWMLKDIARDERISLKYHDVGGSYIEGILSRGDRRLADVIEGVWKRGARFCGWEEHFDVDLWDEILDEHHVDRMTYLGTRSVDAAQPWDHIDVGLAEGFLAWEYRRSLKNRLSVPCGKPNKTLLHHTNIEDAEADHRKLVCYDCGIACDLTQMRDERIEYLHKLDARKPKAMLHLPVLGQGPVFGEGQMHAPASAPPSEPTRRGQGPKPVGFDQEPGRRFRIRFEKRGRGAFIAHLDTMRLLVRAFRRAKIELVYSKGYHPKPVLVFGPALGLGVAALGELCDVRIVWDGDEAALLAALAAVLPDGMAITHARALVDGEPALGKVIGQAELAAYLPGPVSALRSTELVVTRTQKGEQRQIDVGSFLLDAKLAEGEERERLRERFEWPAGGEILVSRVRISGDGGVKPGELVEALTGAAPVEGVRLGRVGVYGADGSDPLAPMAKLAIAPPVVATAPETSVSI